MKIQAAADGVKLIGKARTIHIDNVSGVKAEKDLVLSSGDMPAVECVKMITLPGEYEVADVLIRGMYDAQKKVLYRVTTGEITSVIVPSPLKEIGKEAMNEIGEQIDLLFLTVTDKETLKAAKEIVNDLVPRGLVVVSSLPMPEVSTAVNTALQIPEGEITVKKADLQDDVTLGWYVGV